MSAGTAKVGVVTDHAEAANEKLRVQFNALVTAFDELLAKLDADAGVGSADYASTIDGYAKVNKR